jgi:hypothetical protein
MKTNPKAKVYARVFHSVSRDIIEYVIRFTIGNHIIKRGTLMQNSYIVPLCLNKLCICIGPSSTVKCK